MNAHFDGELYLDDNAPPEMSSFGPLNEEESASFDLVEIDGSAAEKIVFERAIFKYKDLSSPPHTKKECGKWMKPGLGAKICVGWTIRYRYLYRIGIIRIAAVSESEAKSALESCLKMGAVAAAIAAIASGGGAAVAAAELVLKACLVTKLGEKLISLSIDIKSTRGDWE